MPVPLIVAAFAGSLVTAAASMAGRVLISAGVGFVAYQGISILLDSLLSQVQQHLSGAPSQMLGIMSLLEIDTVTSILFSAVAARMVLAGLTSGVVKRAILK